MGARPAEEHHCPAQHVKSKGSVKCGQENTEIEGLHYLAQHIVQQNLHAPFLILAEMSFFLSVLCAIMSCMQLEKGYFSPLALKEEVKLCCTHLREWPKSQGKK